MALGNEIAVAEESKEFVLLKPYCSNILRSPNESNLKEFSKILDDVPHLDGNISEYVVFPIAVHLKFLSRLKENERVCLFSCLVKILEKSKLKSYDLFVELFQRLNVALVSADDPTVVNKKLSEQELELIVTCTLALLENSLDLHFDALFNAERIKIVGFFIFILLELINYDTLVKIRLQALQILEILVVGCRDKDSACTQLFAFFPGIVSSLRKTCSTKVGRVRKKIVLTSIHVLGQTVKVCISHAKAESLIKADQNLKLVVEMISNELVIHASTHFRNALLEFSVELISSVTDKLPGCLEILWRNVWILRSDEDLLILKNTNSFLSSFSEHSLFACNFDQLMSLTKRSIVLHKSNDSNSCLLALKQVSSVLCFLKINFTELQAYFPVISTVISHCLSLKNFTDCDNSVKCDPLVRVCSQACHNIFLAANLEDIIDEFNSYFSQFGSSVNSSSISNGTVFCFNEVLRAYYKALPLEGSASLRTLEPYQVLNLATMYISILDSESTETAICAVSEESLNVQSQTEKKKALFLEGLTVLTQISPSYVLPVSLYTLIENAGTKDSVIISTVASRCLQEIANPSPDINGSLILLMQKNIDLIMSELSVRISNLSVHPNCPNALLFLAEYFDFSSDVFVELVDQIFEKSCDEFNGGYMQLVYARIFFAFISSLWIQSHNKLERTSAIKNNNSISQSLQKCDGQTTKSLYQKMIEYQAAVGLNMENDVSEEPENNDENKTLDADEIPRKEYDEKEDQLSGSLKLVLRITRRVLNFLPNEDRTVRLVAIDTLIKGVTILKDYENTLLPLGHTIWQNLVPRLSEKDYVVVRKSFELLLTMCTACGPFLRKRTSEEVFPKLSALIIMLAGESKKVKNKFRQYYTYTQGYKLQLTVLQGMSQLCESIDVSEDDLMKVVDGAVLYLDLEQHKNLREAAQKLLRCIANGPNCRSVWLSLLINGLVDVPAKINPSFTPLPEELLTTREK